MRDKEDDRRSAQATGWKFGGPGLRGRCLSLRNRPWCVGSSGKSDVLSFKVVLFIYLFDTIRKQDRKHSLQSGLLGNVRALPLWLTVLLVPTMLKILLERNFD